MLRDRDLASTMLAAGAMSDSVSLVQLDQLLQRFAAGDAVAKQALLATAMTRLTRIASRLLHKFGGEARVEMWSMEVLQEAYPRISKALDDVKPVSAEQFFGLARLQMQRALLDKVRLIEGRDGNRPRTKPFSARPCDTTAPAVEIADGENADQQRILVIDLLEAIGRLPENIANTVWRKLAGYSHREIGEQLGVHMDTIDSYWNKAVVKLSRELEPFMDSL